jgi:hypothetical protein
MAGRVYHIGWDFSLPHVMDVAGDVFARCRLHSDVFSLTEGQVIIEGTAVGFDGILGQTPVRLEAEPGFGNCLGIYKRKLVPIYFYTHRSYYLHIELFSNNGG